MGLAMFGWRFSTRLGVAVICLVVAPSLPVRGDHLVIGVEYPETVSIGEVVTLSVVVTSAETNVRIPNAEVVARREITFAGVTDTVVLARSITDDAGVATLRWEEQMSGLHPVTIEYRGPEDSTPEAVEIRVEGTDQVVRSTSGVRLPLVGGWVIILLLGATWSLILVSLWRVIMIARSSVEPDDLVDETPEAM
jgi:hypothetical protein